MKLKLRQIEQCVPANYITKFCHCAVFVTIPFIYVILYDNPSLDIFKLINVSPCYHILYLPDVFFKSSVVSWLLSLFKTTGTVLSFFSSFTLCVLMVTE